MMYLYKKVFKDIWRMKIQFIGVILMSMLGIMFFSAMEGAWYGMQVSGDKYFEETNLADVWIFCTHSTEDNLRIIEEMEQVRDADMQIKLNVRNRINEEITYLEIIHSYKNIVSRNYLIEGAEYQPEEKGVWLHSDYAKANEYQVGDSITIDYNGMKSQSEIKGLIQNPEYIAYTGSSSAATLNSNMYGYAMVGTPVIEELIGHNMFNIIPVTLNDGYEIAEFKDLLADKLGDVYITALDRDTNKNISPFIDKTEQIRSMSILFSALFICLAFMTMYISMKRLISVQRVQLGTLGAIGFSQSSILMSCALYGLIVSVIGSVIGLLLGKYWISSVILNLQRDFYSMPNWNTVNTYFSVIILIATLLCCTLTAALTSKKTVSEMPAIAMRTIVPDVGKRFVGKNKISSTTHRLFLWKWMLRDVYRNKVRSIISTIGVCGSVVVLFAAFGLNDSLEYTVDYIYNQQYDYSNKIFLIPSAGEEEINKLSNRIGDGQKSEEVIAYIGSSGTNEIYAIVTVLGEGSMIKLKTESGKPVLVNDGVFITAGAAAELGIEAGEDIYFRLNDSNDKINCEIKDILDSPSPQGIYLSRDTWEELGFDFIPTAFYTLEEIEETSLDEFAAFRDYILKENQEQNTAEVLESAILVIFILIAAAVFLCIVILYNLGSISYIEREREYATLLVIGFRKKEIYGIIIRESIFQTIIGLIFGLPFGYLFLNIYVSVVSTDNMKYLVSISLSSVLYIIAIVLGCTLAVSLFIYAKTSKIDMCESLKAVD